MTDTNQLDQGSEEEFIRRAVVFSALHGGKELPNGGLSGDSDTAHTVTFLGVKFGFPTRENAWSFYCGIGTSSVGNINAHLTMH